MKISIIRAQELDPAAYATWLRFHRSNPALLSPYFSPDFTLVVAAVRTDVRVAVVEDDGKVVGVLPFQRQGHAGVPVGAPLSDHHGFVCDSNTRCPWSPLLRAAGLSHWSFDHLPQVQAPHVDVAHSSSPVLDLSQGFAAYRDRNEAISRRIRKLQSRRRQFAREAGPLRLEEHTQDRSVFDAVLRLKSQQYHRTGAPDIFALAWTRELLERLWQAEQPHFGGRLSALYAGDALVGAHLGMRSERVLHWWFPVYEQAQAKHSPGLHLLLMVAEAAAAARLETLDLGKGSEDYKQNLADSSLPLVEGWVGRPSLTTALLTARDRTRRWLSSSAALQPLRPLVRKVRSVL